MGQAKVVESRNALRDRVRRFVVKELLPHPDFIELQRFASSYGSMAIFGGLVRDLALGHSEAFGSDIDIVVQGIDNKGIQRITEKFVGRGNSFGGSRFAIGRWVFDVWPLEQTWAFKKRGSDTTISKFVDLLDTTFLNVDAAIYDLDEGSLEITPNYIKDLVFGHLDVNYADTPNEIGAAVKTLRMMAINNFTLSQRLAGFLHASILRYGVYDLVAKDQASSAVSRLDANFVGSVAIALRSYQARNSSGRFSFDSFQPELPFSE